MFTELVEYTDTNELVYELDSIKQLVCSAPGNTILEPITDSQERLELFEAFQNTSCLNAFLPYNAANTINVYAIALEEDNYSQSFILGCSIDMSLIQLHVVFDCFKKISEAKISACRWEVGMEEKDCTEVIEENDRVLISVISNILSAHVVNKES